MAQDNSRNLAFACDKYGSMGEASMGEVWEKQQEMESRMETSLAASVGGSGSN